MTSATRIGFSLATLMVFAVPVASAQQGPAIGGSLYGIGQSAGASSPGTGAAKGPGGTLTAVPEDFSKLKIAPGFLLNIQVYDEPELSGELRVDDAGNIAFPLAGFMLATTLLKRRGSSLRTNWPRSRFSSVRRS